MSTQSVDVLVIGAGPAGTIAASIINQAGYKVKIVEKEKFPRFVIGESLLPRCMEALEEAKFLDAVKAKGFQEKLVLNLFVANTSCVILIFRINLPKDISGPGKFRAANSI